MGRNQAAELRELGRRELSPLREAKETVHCASSPTGRWRTTVGCVPSVQTSPSDLHIMRELEAGIVITAVPA